MKTGNFLILIGVFLILFACTSENNETHPAGLPLIAYNPYETVDWSNEQGYYAFHVHIRQHDKGIPDARYEETGHRGAVIGDAWCRTDHDQVHGYWPWFHRDSGEMHTGERLNAWYSEGMVAIPGGEYDGRGISRDPGFRSQKLVANGKRRLFL